MTGSALKKNYSTPGKSSKAETGKIKSFGNRLAITVSPGAGGPQVDSFHDVFNPEDPVDGVVFVAGSGLVTLRDEKAIQANIQRGYDNIASWRKLNKKAELEYLRNLSSIIRSAKAKSRSPRWMLVAATKVDLYYSEIEEEKVYYSPHGESEFCTTLDNLRLDVGRDNLEWDAVPVCSQLEDFVWGEEVLESVLNTEDRDHFLAQFTRRLGELCR